MSAPSSTSQRGDWSTLDGVLAGSWAMMARGVQDDSDPFHTATLASFDGSRPRLRTVVLREAESHNRRLACFTDVRSRKVAEVRRHPTVSWLFFHPPEGVQLVLEGPAEVHVDDTVASHWWDSIGAGKRLWYGGSVGPGIPVERPWTGLPQAFAKRPPGLEETESWRAHFAVITCRVETLDWLLLGRRGNLRARFSWRAGDPPAGWLTP